MNRRGFLRNLLLAAPALAFDPERLLWVPGAKKIFIPPAWTWTFADIPDQRFSDKFMEFTSDFHGTLDAKANEGWPQIFAYHGTA